MPHFSRAALAAPFLLPLCGAALAQQPVSGNAFNPAISLILNGHYASYSRDPAGFELPGFLLDEGAAVPSEGLSLDETELALSANIDDKYYGSFTASLEQDGGETSVELEEAYVETLSLPRGLKVKAGRFLSEIGYLNPIHAHAWDFDDAPLAYVAMLNTSYADTGLQLRWVVPTTLFVEVGGELMRGDSFPAANGAASDGSGAWTVFAHVGGDVGTTSSWRAGVSRISADANGRASLLAGGSAVFNGSSDVTIADFVWKWAKNGNPRDRYYTVQAEYLHRREDGNLGLSTLAAGDESGLYRGTQSGYYVQGVYQFRPRWRVGARFDRLDASNAVDVTAPTPLTASRRPSRVSAMTDFSNSEFSRLRLQLSRDDSRELTDDQVVLQYIMSLG
ncbi:MAG TPA: outer membrane beta-barrel protein, partial [Gammaproteobacteria bacterium]|nr:outer membrane beta-barrel protein [Gammaproteobacteria bacterium]